MKRTSLPAGRERSLRQALREYARGIVGGLLFSLVSGDGVELRPSGIIGSFVGALIVLGVWGWVRGRRT